MGTHALVCDRMGNPMHSVVETVGKMMPRVPRLLCDASVIMVKSVESKWLFYGDTWHPYSVHRKE